MLTNQLIAKARFHASVSVGNPLFRTVLPFTNLFVHENCLGSNTTLQTFCFSSARFIVTKPTAACPATDSPRAS